MSTCLRSWHTGRWDWITAMAPPTPGSRCSKAPFHGTWVASPDLGPALYAAFLRGVTQAVRRIKADKRRYVTYFKEGWAAGDPAVQALTADDFNLGRIQLREPTPIPEDEARWAWDWMASWGVLRGEFDVTAQINRKVEREAHALAFAG